MLLRFSIHWWIHDHHSTSFVVFKSFAMHLLSIAEILTNLWNLYLYYEKNQNATVKFIVCSLPWCLFFFNDENFLYFSLLTAFTNGDCEKSSGFFSFCSNFCHLNDYGLVVRKVSLNRYLLFCNIISGVNGVTRLLQWLNVFLVEFNSTVRVNLFSFVIVGFIYGPKCLYFYTFESFSFSSISSVNILRVVLLFLNYKLSILTWFPSLICIFRDWSSEWRIVFKLLRVICSFFINSIALSFYAILLCNLAIVLRSYILEGWFKSID